jgi:uncharacterized membrane protein
MASTPGVPNHVSENIETIAQLNAASASRISRHQRAIEALTGQLGRPRALYMLVGAAAVWVIYNAATRWTGWPAVDHPPFYGLQGVLTAYAAVVATTVLTAQNRLNHEADRRAHLDLQLSLIAEQKATKIISLLEELRRDLPNVRDRKDAVAEAMQQRANPAEVLSAFETTIGSPHVEPTTADETSGATSNRSPSTSGLGATGDGSK